MKSISLTTEMKATEQHFPVELLTMLYKFVQRKATEQNYPVVSLIMKYIRWSSLTFESVNKILWWNHSNKSLQAVLSHGAVQMYIIHVLYKVVQTCKSVDEILKCDQTHFKRNRFIFLPSWNSAFELPIVWLLLLGYVCAFESVKSSSITTKEGTVQGACETLLF